ncbi:MAG: MerR family transcriptional regulator [Thiotrichales bacterium]|nr:MerR family transcriptional regulator [Thiotrichales bacterium]
MQQTLYPIREVSRLTGINAITLRAWERRYGLVEPVRTESGHRLYTDEHIEVIKRAVELTRQGVAISQVKSVLQTSPLPTRVNHELDDLHQRLDQALQTLSALELQAVLDRLFVELDEYSVFSLLAQQELVEMPAEQRVLWQSLLLPRLYSRLRFMQQRMYALKSQAPSAVYLLRSPLVPSPIAEVLCALWLMQLGVQPLLAGAESLPAASQMKRLNCTGMLLLVQQDLSEFGLENDRLEAYSALENVLISIQPNPSVTSQPIQWQSKTFGQLFGEAVPPQWALFH